MKKLNAVIALLLISTMLNASVTELYSPRFAGGSFYTGDVVAPQSGIRNAALPAQIQRYTFDINYLLLKGLGSEQSGMGHVANLSAAFPFHYGVLSTTGQFLYTGNFAGSKLDYGTNGSFQFNFAKEIYSDLFIGAGITTGFGSKDGVMDWGLGGNLGIFYNWGTLGPLKDFRWGFAMNNMGKDFNGLYPAFTPVLYGDFIAYENDTARVQVLSELSFPGFTDTELLFGASLVLFENLSINTSSRLVISDLIDGDVNRLIPSLGVYYNLKIGEEERDLKTYASATPYTDGIWAFGLGGSLPLGAKDTNPPEVEITYGTPQYISPNFDGIKDVLEFPVSARDERYIAGYSVTIKDTYGNTVKVIKNKDERPENESFRNLFDKLISPKTGIPVPESFRWDGKTDSGEEAPDGKYTFSVSFTDDNGNSRIMESRTFFIDTEKPEIVLSKPDGLDLIFSPNGDGNKDTFIVEQTGSSEFVWDAKVLDINGDVVWSKQITSSEPVNLEWDGKDNTGFLVPDGVYQYALSSTDLAGNSNSDVIDNIIINTQQPPVGITIDTASFSPNGDSIKDSVGFVMDIPVKTGIIQWELQVLDEADSSVRVFSTESQGFSVIEDTIVFDGRDSEGIFLAEGIYKGRLTVEYQNGHKPTVDSPEFRVDITPPSAEVKADYTMFSPNGDVRKDEMLFRQTTSVEEEWTGTVYNEAGEVVKQVNWKNRAPETFTWNGKDEEGNLLEDGNYSYLLESTDYSGNRGASESLPFVLNTQETKAVLALSDRAFSPTEKGLNASVEIIPEIDAEIPVVDYTLEVIDSEEQVVASLGSGRDMKTLYSWNGVDNKGQKAPEGNYKAALSVEFENGNLVTTRTGELVLDTVVPEALVTLKEKFHIFSPNGDGKKDAVSFDQKTSKEAIWTGSLVNDKGEVVRSFNWKDNAPLSFSWDGKDKDNMLLPDGDYIYQLTSVDSAGNRGVSEKIAVVIDTENAEVFVSTSERAFSPNGDGAKDSVLFVPNLKKTDGIDSVEYRVLGSENQVIKSIVKTDGFTEPVLWDGTGAGGRTSDGVYNVELVVNYKRGDSPLAGTSVILDTQAPEALVSADNMVFSPNGDNRKDLVVFTTDTSDEAFWTASVTDKNGKVIKSSEWEGTPDSSWSWDGRNGDINVIENGDYVYQLTAEDEAGNRYESSKMVITLDISSSNVLLSSDLEAFSPNKDGIKDSMTFTSRVETTSPIESYTLDIVNRAGETVKTFTGKRDPGKITWDGLNNEGQRASDDVYKAKMTLVTINGNSPQSQTGDFLLDTEYPSLTLQAENTLFSPDGDTLKDSVIFHQKGEGEELYTGEIYDEKGTLVRQWHWNGTLNSVSWDGKDKSGNVMPDGSYSYKLFSTDAAGNTTVKNVAQMVVDTRPTVVYITVKKTAFAPDLVQEHGPQSFGLIVNEKEGIESWSVAIRDDEGTLYKTLTGGETVPKNVEWDGKDEEGRFVDADLKAELNVVYARGNSPRYSTKTFTADSQKPLVKVGINPVPFSPDDDYLDDELTISMGVKDASEIEEWKLEVKDPRNNTFITFEGVGKPGREIIWDGKSNKGELVQAAEDYPFVMTVKDAVGHTGTFEGEIPVDIMVIKDGDRLKIKISSIIFEPNSAELSLSGEKGESNNKILKRLAEILGKYSSYKIIVEGHANNIYGDEITGKQRESLKDFSKKRAEAVVDALTDNGVSAGRMSVVGVGGDDPVVSFLDYNNTWKNRRVEFILVK